MSDKQYGAVLVFRPDMSEAKIKAVLAMLAEVIDQDYYASGKGPQPQEFDPRYGGPVWYVP